MQILGKTLGPEQFYKLFFMVIASRVRICELVLRIQMISKSLSVFVIKRVFNYNAFKPGPRDRYLLPR